MKENRVNMNKTEWFLNKEGKSLSDEAKAEMAARTLAGTLGEVTEEYSPKYVYITLAGSKYGMPKSCLPFAEEYDAEADYKVGETLIMEGGRYKVVGTSDSHIRLACGGKTYNWSRSFVKANMMTVDEYDRVCVTLESRESIVAEYADLAGENDNELIGKCFAMLVERYYNDLMDCCSPTEGTERERTIEDFERRVMAREEQFAEANLSDPITLAMCRLNIGYDMAELDLPRQNRIAYTDKYIKALEGLWMLMRIYESDNVSLGFFAVKKDTPNWYLTETIECMLDNEDYRQLEEWRQPNYKAMNAARSSRKFGRI